MVKQKSISANVIFSVLNVFVSMFFPLVTYPYISRVLQVDNIGAINFGLSIVEYFTIFALFGISGFAVRTGSRIRNQMDELQRFASQIFSLNIITTIISFMSLIFFMLLPTKVVKYRNIIIVQSIVMLVSPLTLEWLYSIFEDFFYVTIRNFIVKFFSLIAIFLFVKQQSDTMTYVFIVSVSAVVVGFINFFYAKKYIRLKFTLNTGWSSYKGTLVVFFINSIASTIYLNSDKTMLGLFCDDHSVGLYSTATNIYMIVKRIVAAGTLVIIPRLALLWKSNRDEFVLLVEKAVRIMIFLGIPVATGSIVLSSELVLIVSGIGYEQARQPLIILSFAVIFAALANLFASGVLISQQKEKLVMHCTIISSVINIILNFVFIPLWKENGAALTTLLSEIVMAIMSICYSYGSMKGGKWKNTLCKTIIGTVIMMIVCVWMSVNLNHLCTIARLIIIMLLGIMVYLVVEVILKEEIIIAIIRAFKNKIQRIINFFSGGYND